MQGIATSDVLTIIGIVIGLAVQAIGLTLYWNRAINTQATDSQKAREALRAGFEKTVEALRAGFSAELASHRTASEKALELLHGRINNIRREFVLGEQYQRDLTELKQGNRDIMQAIAGVSETMRNRMRDVEGTQIRHDMRLVAMEKRTGGPVGAGE